MAWRGAGRRCRWEGCTPAAEFISPPACLWAAVAAARRSGTPNPRSSPAHVELGGDKGQREDLGGVAPRAQRRGPRHQRAVLAQRGQLEHGRRRRALARHNEIIDGVGAQADAAPEAGARGAAAVGGGAAQRQGGEGGPLVCACATRHGAPDAAAIPGAARPAGMCGAAAPHPSQVHGPAAGLLTLVVARMDSAGLPWAVA